MKIKPIIILGIFLALASCNNDSPTKAEISDSTNVIVSDSSQVKIEHDRMVFKNVIFSLEEFHYKNEYREFICKTSSESIDKTRGLRLYKEKREFYDSKMNKTFEISAEQRTIELKRDYYETHGIGQALPTYFELNNYETGLPFVKCTGSLWTIEVPNTETIAFLGYRSVRSRIDSLTIGEFYFSINQTKNVKLIIKASSYDLSKIIYPDLGFRLESRNPKDRVFRNTNLELWSKNKQIGDQFITDINLIIKASYNLSDKDWENNYSKEFIIPIENGKIQADKISEGIYEFVIND